MISAFTSAPADELDGAVRASHALALVDLGVEREAVAISLTALSQDLPQYTQSLARYAQAISVKASGVGKNAP